MAFKMKGSPMARNYGATFNKNVEPEQEAAETAQRNSELGAAAGSAQAKKDFETETITSNDNRSYRITSKKIEDKLGFKPKNSVEDAIRSLYENFENQNVKNPFDNKLFFNVQVMKKLYEQK